MLAVSFAVAFGLTWFVWKEETEEEAEEAGADGQQGKMEKIGEEAAVAEGEKTLFAPLKGNIIQREDIPDETFASGVLGNGVGIELEEEEVIAPFDGEISSVAETLHALGITGPGGMEVLIHVGIDTVNLKGDGFEVFVSEGEKVTAGQKLMHFDMAKIREKGYSTTTAVLLTNSDDYPGFHVLKTGKTERMEKLFTAEA